MRYDNPEIQDWLAAQYALGSLTGLTRRRLETLMSRRPELRSRVTAWQERLAPLAETAPPIVPPGHVLTALHRRLSHDHPTRQHRPAGAAGSWWNRVVAWRWMTGAATAIAIALMAYVAFDISVRDQPLANPSYVAVLSDPSATPGLVVTAFSKPWRLTVEPLDSLSAPNGAILQIWAVEHGTGTSRPLVRIDQQAPVQRALTEQMWVMLETAESLIVTLDEADAESPGPVLYAGLCIRLAGPASGPAS